MKSKNILFDIRLLIFLTIIVSGTISCKKIDDWLDKKSNLSDVRPSSLKDFQAIFDNIPVMNESMPQHGLVAMDNFFINNVKYASITSQTEKNLYTFENDAFLSTGGPWTAAYLVVGYANIVLDGLVDMDVPFEQQAERNNVNGQALFHKALSYYSLAQMYCRPYNKPTATTDLGVPLRLKSDVNEVSVRSTIEQTYARILEDLKQAILLLPPTQLYKTRPSRAAAKFLLAKTYLVMEDYEKARDAATEALGEYNTLLDFNSLTISTTNPFPAILSNPEVVFYGISSSALRSLQPFRALHNVDTLLFQQYAANDRRKGVFYRADGAYQVFKGPYNQTNNTVFSGLATNEIYLIRAESYARTGNVPAALDDLNTLLKNRFNTAGFVPAIAPDADAALVMILNERRKELPFTGQIRWEDLRRLNKDSHFAKSVVHIANGNTYTLPPNDNRYVFLIPPIEIQQYGLQQNPR